jgi:hypothetical protein
MATDTVTQEEIQAFGDKLEAFGNTLSEREQRILAEILLRAASAGDDVEGHMVVPRSWPEVRQHLGDVLVHILEGMGTLSPYNGAEI